MSSYIVYAYNALDEIYRQGAYMGIVMNELTPKLKREERPSVTRIVHGVVERHEEFSYMLAKLCKKSPKAVVRVILRLGMYLIKYMNSVPDYAAVNELVELTKAIGKKELASFVNGTLKKYIVIKDSLPPSGLTRLALDNNIPLWLVKKYIADYGEEKGLERITQKSSPLTHIRNNSRIISKDGLEKLLIEKGVEYKPTEYGFLIGATDAVSELLDTGKATVQALGSMIAARALTPEAISGRILDVCASPGGKAVYLAELNREAEVLALDVYPHRVELIKSYAKRMGAANVKTEVCDGTLCNIEWLDAFDTVLLDAPCSGFGVRGSNPDIIINKKEADIVSLAGLQKKLLSVAANYVKRGGALVYSTCTDVLEENESVVTAFLSERTDFELESADIGEENNGMHCFLSDKNGREGFFVARLKRTI